MSSIIERETALLAKLKETNYKMFDGNRDEALDFVISGMESMVKYANIVIEEQIRLPIFRMHLDGQELRDATTNLDSRRRSIHEAAIASVSSLNRCCDRLGIARIADIDTTDRHAVADFIGQFVNETYNAGIGKGIDDATYNRKEYYDTKKVERDAVQLDESLLPRGYDEDNQATIQYP